MKILYITTFYNFKDSSAAVRNNALVKGLLELGHEVDVQTIRFSDDMTSPDLNYGNVIYTDLFNWSSRQSLGAKVASNKLLTLMRNVYVTIRKYGEFPDKFHGWIDKIDIKRIPLKDYDLMISSSDGKTSHFVAEHLKKAQPSLKWIQIWGDPWYDDVNLKGFNKWRTKRAEKKILSAADEIVYISAPTAKVMVERYNNLANHIHFIPRSYFYEYAYKVPSEGDMHIVYAGSIYVAHGRNICSIVNALTKYNKTAVRKLYLDVYGVVDAPIKNECKADSIVFHESIDVKQLGEVYKCANALLFISNKAGSTQIPGKLYDYLGTSSTILCLVNNTTDGIAEFLKSLGERSVLVINDEESIAAALPEVAKTMERSFVPAVDYSAKAIAGRILELAKQ